MTASQPQNGYPYGQQPFTGHHFSAPAGGQFVYGRATPPYPAPPTSAPAPRTPHPYGWGRWAAGLGALAVFAGVLGGATVVDCTSAEQNRIDAYTAAVEAARERDDMSNDYASRRAANARAEELKAQSAAAEKARSECTRREEKSRGQTSVLIGIGGLGILAFGIGLTRILAVGTRVTDLGAAVYRLVKSRANKAPRSRAPEFAAPTYPQEQPYVEEFPTPGNGFAAQPYIDVEPEPTPEPEPSRPRDGWSQRRNIDFGED